MTKMTYTQALEIAIAAVDGEAKERLEALKVSIEKRNSADRKPTKTQRENEVLKEELMVILTTDGRQCKDLANVLAISPQKCSALLAQLVKEGKAEKYIEKRVTYFKRVA